jgi:hypothetical protein
MTALAPMYDLKKLDQIERDFAEQDKRWNGGRLVVLGIVSLAIFIATIYMMSRTEGCHFELGPPL